MQTTEGQCQHNVLESTFTDTKYVVENQNSKRHSGKKFIKVHKYSIQTSERQGHHDVHE
jgi:hypothetical protein